MDFDELKVRIKAGAIKRGFPPPVEVVVAGEIYRIFKSEARATKSEIMAMIEEVKQMAAELGILLPEYPEAEAGGEVPVRVPA